MIFLKTQTYDETQITTKTYLQTLRKYTGIDLTKNHEHVEQSSSASMRSHWIQGC